MIDAVFISDLHLHPDDKAIKARFDAFLVWAQVSVKVVYILGDFFHVWAGDDSLNDWSRAIALQIKKLVTNGIKVFYMAGNRDFLLGKQFAALAGWSILKEPSIIQLGGEKILLVHGDRYCTKDYSHRVFRLLTRNRLFSYFFLKIALQRRLEMVNKVRAISKANDKKTIEQMDVVPQAVIAHMQRYSVHTLIHGHTHRPGITSYEVDHSILKRYVLSDWDDKPTLLCYDRSIGFYFEQCIEVLDGR